MGETKISIMTDRADPGDLFARLAKAPNPAERAFLHRNLDRDVPASVRWIRNKELRSTIFAATRKLLCEVEFHALTVKAVANICNISIPTIYNVVGDRTQLLQDCLIELVEWIVLLPDTKVAHGASPLAILVALWSSAIDNRALVSKAAKVSASPASPLNRSFIEAGTRLILAELNETKARGSIRDFVDLQSLARQLAQTIHCSVCAWSEAPYCKERFKLDLVSGPGLMLLGALRGDEAERVERELHAIVQRRSCLGGPPMASPRSPQRI